MKNKVSILITGPAGLGIQTIENLICKIFKKACFNIFSTKEYMSRVRGGANTTTIIICERKINAFYENIDILLSLYKNGIGRIKDRVKEDTLILGDVEKEDKKTFKIDFLKIAKEIGDIVYSNSIAVGVLLGLFQKEKEISENIISEMFKTKGEETIKKNIIALNYGYFIGKEIKEKTNFRFEIKSDENIRDEIFLNGAESVGIGAIIGGCNFVSSYPMTPSTPLFTFLAQNSKKFNIVVEQAEDEISAINMVLGSWYAGGRGLVTTSGGGFSLMVESLSLAGMIESPIVIHLGQRPGPATGLPTRTEQGDLLFSIFAGHGEFPRIILSPGDLSEGILLTEKAFNLADKYQIPVIILTDQYFIDTFYNIKIPPVDLKPKYYFSENIKFDYKRYKFIEDGVSERGIPGGNGFVCVDSDEHDEEGHITEDRNIRKLMVEKRNKKIKKFIDTEIINPSFFGNKDYEILLISWGSTKNIVLSAIENIENEKIGYLHFPLVWPLPKIIDEYIRKSKKTIVIENNYNSQFSKLIKMETGIEIKEKILKYDGHPFSVEEIKMEIEKRI